MRAFSLFPVVIAAAIANSATAQETTTFLAGESPLASTVGQRGPCWTRLVEYPKDAGSLLDTDVLQPQRLRLMQDPVRVGLGDSLVRGQSPDGGGGDGDGAGAAAATDPSAILTQLQLQNVFTPKTYDADGYSNTFIVQPVLPFPVASPLLRDYFPAHIMRPTLPIIAPSANPDGPLGVQGGLGDLTLLDAFVHPVEGFGTVLLGYTAILPTSTDPQLGLGEWQLGPAAAVLYKQIPKTLVGFIYQQPFSFQSDAQQVLFAPIFVRHLPCQWYIRWGDLNWVFNTETGDYNIPLNVALGKVGKLGDRPVNVFVQPFYTPEGLRSGPASEWGVKLNLTFLFPEKKFGPLFGGGCCRRH